LCNYDRRWGGGAKSEVVHPLFKVFVQARRGGGPRIDLCPINLGRAGRYVRDVHPPPRSWTRACTSVPVAVFLPKQATSTSQTVAIVSQAHTGLYFYFYVGGVQGPPSWPSAREFSAQTLISKPRSGSSIYRLKTAAAYLQKITIPLLAFGGQPCSGGGWPKIQGFFIRGGPQIWFWPADPSKKTPVFDMGAGKGYRSRWAAGDFCLERGSSKSSFAPRNLERNVISSRGILGSNLS
jgi:hypothetical protein